MNETIIFLLVLGVFGAVAFSFYQGYTKGRELFVCKRCGHTGEGKKVTKGNFIIEVILWLCFIIPGLIYTVWRLSSRYTGCSVCGSNEVIPAGSPVGQKLIADLKKE